MNDKILNLTQHMATPDQVKAGVHEPVHKDRIQSLLNFVEIPTEMGMKSRAEKLAYYAAEDGYVKAMIGGAPYFMSHLEKALKAKGIIPVYAFSARISTECEQADGSVKKVNTFKHLGFYEVN